MKPGDLLTNGATVVDCVGEHVLADRGEGLDDRWVTWAFNGQGETCWGHYFSDKTEALADLLKRGL